MDKYEYVKVGNLFHKVIRQALHTIECEETGYTEAEMFEMMNMQNLKHDALAMHYYGRFKDTEEMLMKVRKECADLKEEIDKLRTGSKP